MKVFQTLLLCISLATTTTFARPTKERDPNACEVLKSVKLSFYGRPDTRDPIAYPECGRRIPGGKGTYESPLTMATAPGEFAKCEIIYVPYLLKYVRFEDICLDCVTEYAKGQMHMQIWTGNEMAGGQEQIQCEKELTPTYAMSVVQRPGKGQLLDETPLYQWGATDPCRLDHRYQVLNVNAFCYSRKEKASDHTQDQKNSVSAFRRPNSKPHDEPPQQEEQQPIQYEEMVQDQEVIYQPEEADWKLIDEPDPSRMLTEEPASPEPRINL